MKKTLSILLIATLLVGSIVGVSAAVTKSTATDDSANPPASTQTYERTETATPKKTADTQQAASDDLVIPDVTGSWKHENNPGGCSIEVTNQDGRHIDFSIYVSNQNATKIAISRVSATLDDVYSDGNNVRANGSFEYTDSFGNKGTGTIQVSENVILLVIDEDYNSGCGWGISRATGDYIFYSKDVNPTPDQQETNNEPVLPELQKVWKNENNPNGCSIVINNQDGKHLDFTVTSMKENASQIATSHISVTLDTENDGSLVRGYADFEYVDSFGNGGTGSISVSENAILLVINQEFGSPSWSIANATGTYY